MTATRKNAVVQAALTELDADMVGVARLEDIKGTMLEAQVLRLLPAARSIVVLGVEVWTEFLDLTAPAATATSAWASARPTPWATPRRASASCSTSSPAAPTWRRPGAAPGACAPVPSPRRDITRDNRVTFNGLSSR
jgi:hypothetical protein